MATAQARGARNMSAGDLAGWMAAGLTLLTFSMRSMVWLRLVALAANLCFIGYGVLGELYPVVALHVLLIPCNLYRLSELCAAHRGARPQPGRWHAAAGLAGRRQPFPRVRADRAGGLDP